MIDASLMMMSDDIIYLHSHLIIILNHSWPSSTNWAYVSLIRLAKEDYALSKSTCGQGYQNAIHSTLQGHERDCEFMNNKLIFIIKDLVTFRFSSFQLLTNSKLFTSWCYFFTLILGIKSGIQPWWQFLRSNIAPAPLIPSQHFYLSFLICYLRN